MLRSNAGQQDFHSSLKRRHVLTFTFDSCDVVICRGFLNGPIKSTDAADWWIPTAWKSQFCSHFNVRDSDTEAQSLSQFHDGFHHRVVIPISRGTTLLLLHVTTHAGISCGVVASTYYYNRATTNIVGEPRKQQIVLAGLK